MAFQAQWAGTCDNCEERFSPGDYIERAPGGFCHAGVCPVLVEKRHGTVCSACFTERSLTGECDC